MKTNRFNFDMWDKKDKKYIKNVHKFFDLNECIENLYKIKSKINEVLN